MLSVLTAVCVLLRKTFDMTSLKCISRTVFFRPEVMTCAA